MLRHSRPASDHDVATPARPDQVAALFRKVVPTGVEHGTVTVVASGTAVEVTTFRGEGTYVDGRRPSSVIFHDDLEQDLGRRDFTVNALAYDPLREEFRDPFRGRDDLRRRILRAVGDPAARFAEDGLRPVRAVRFAAQLGFRLDRATAAAIRPALPVAAKVSIERLTDEASRLLVAPHARRGVQLLHDTGLLAVVLPDLPDLPRRRLSHALDVLAAIEPSLTLRLAALLHVAPRAGMRPDEIGEMLRHRRFPRHVSERVGFLLLGHECLLSAGRAPPPAPGAQTRRWLSRAGRHAPDLLALWAADARAARPPARSRRELAALRAFRARLARVRRQGPPLCAADLALDGRAIMDVLGAGPGPAVGEALRHLLERVLDDPRLNVPTALASELKRWWASRGPDGASQLS